jgi:hypothetical protein
VFSKKVLNILSVMVRSFHKRKDYPMPRQTQLSKLFADPALRAAFAAAERDQEPDAFAVPVVSPLKPLTDGAAVGWRATPDRLERALCED